MAISDRDRKLLWARSGNICAFPGCRREITQDKADGGGAFPVAPEAHIVGRDRNSPRGDHPMPRPERETYPNFILLCPTHHTIIDNDTATYTVENIREMKADHERWVRQNLSAKGPPAVSLSKLPSTGPDLFGRDRELALLDQAWEDPNTNIIAFIAFGGIGKSALITHWLRRLAKDECRGARRVFGWSFYSQGQREHTVSADLFIDTALRFFGDPKPEEGSPWDKGGRLARLVQEQPTILALDGIEPLQSTIEDGKINDPALDTLLRELAYGMNGLCLLTSRVDFPDLPLSDVQWEPGPPGDAVRGLRVNLERLSPEAGRHLLRQAGIKKGLDSELDSAVEEYEGHALALVLLGEYLAKFLDADIAKRDLIPPFPDKTRAGRHAFRVMAAYDNALANDGLEAERAILRIVGLFDRPAGKGCLDALRQPPAIEGVTDAVVTLTDRQWRESVGPLRQLRLLSPHPDPDDGSLDAHPLVREWFGTSLEHESGVGFREAHCRLYDHLRLNSRLRPSSLPEMLPLFKAVRHACCATRYDHVVDFVLDRRIHRGVAFSLYQLGAYGLELSVLADFFCDPWQRLHPAIERDHQALLLNVTGLCLYALGRMTEAESLHSSLLIRAIDAQDWEPAAAAASGLVDVHIAVGDLYAAEESARAECQSATRTRQNFLSLVAYAHRGTVCHLRGALAQAQTEFSSAEEYAPAVHEGSPYICSVAGSRYDDYLLTCGKRTSVRRRASRGLALARRHRWLLDTGLALLDKVRSRAPAIPSARQRKPRATEALPASIARDLSLALASLRRSNHHDDLVKGLLVAACLHRDFGARRQAGRDLNEALDLSSRISLRLHETDARLLEGHMALDEDPPDLDTAEASLARAAQLVADTGYHLRDADILILEGRLLSKKGDKETGRAKLNEAIAVARREEKDGCVYQLAIDQATRYLNEIT